MKIGMKIISLTLCIALLICVLPANAANLGSTQQPASTSDMIAKRLLGENATAENITKADKDLSILKNFRIDDTYLTGINNKNGSLSYTFSFPDAKTDEIKVNRTSAGVTFYIWEKELYNEVFYSDTGEIYLNGKKVTANKIETTSSYVIPLGNSDQIKGSYSYYDGWMAGPPIGSESDYTSFQYGNYCYDVALQNTWIAITVVAFNIIMAVVLPAWASVTYTVMSGFLSLAQLNNPYSTSASYGDYVFYHYNGYWVNPFVAVEQHRLTLYTMPDLGGVHQHTNSYWFRQIIP